MAEAQLQAVREMDPEVSTRLEDLDEEELRDEGIVVKAAIRAVLQEMVNSDNILYDKLCEYGGRVEYVCGTCKERDRQYGRPVYSYGDEIGAELAESVFRSMVKQFAKENGIEL